MMAAICNASGNFKKAMSANDFIPKFKAEKPMDGGEIFTHIMAGMAGLGVTQ